MTQHKIYQMSFAVVYPHYVAKIQKKGKTVAELDEIIKWLTGYTADGLSKALATDVSFQAFFGNAPKLNPRRRLITGVICGVRVEEINEPLMQEIRYLDKLVDKLAKGKRMPLILRSSPE